MSEAANAFDLRGRTALVTGGSRGLGRETVLAFAGAGADVMIVSRKLAACEALAEEVRETTGLNAMTLGCARAFGPSVRVNAVLPGAFMTDIAEHWDMDRFQREAQAFALRRGAQPPEIAGTMLYLASDASSYTTGALLRVDGGYLPEG